MATVERTFVSPEEVYPGRTVSYGDLAGLARSLNRAAALRFLGFVNLLLSVATVETHLTNRTDPVRDVQTWVLRNVLSATLLRDLQETFGTTSLLHRPLLHRTQVLFAIRLVATHGTTEGGNHLDTRDDHDSIGDLLFLINGLFAVAPPSSKAAVPIWLATEIGPLWETENPPALELSWPRTSELLARRLPAAVASQERFDEIQNVVSSTTGFDIEAWIDLNWMFFSYLATVSFQELIETPGRAYLDLGQAHELISTENLNIAVSTLGVKFEDLPTALGISTFTAGTLFDLTPFRTKPIWLMPDGTALCIDPVMLMERLGPHAFWTVMNAMATSDQRRTFSAAWGLAFEAYCNDRLATVFKGKKWVLQISPRDAATNDELFDAIARREDTAIVLECKGTYITSSDKYSRVPAKFFRGLSRKFGKAKHGGIHQLVRGISRTWLHPADRGKTGRKRSITNVYPVLVVQDPCLGAGPVARVLSDRFEAAIERALARCPRPVPKIWPLTVVMADDLDRLAASVEATGQRVDSLLKRFHRRYPSRARPLGEFLDTGKNVDFGFPERVAAILRAEFRAATDQTMLRFKEMTYKTGTKNT